VLGLGSNRPHRGLSSRGLINSAAAELQKNLGRFRLSPLYRTNPLYVTDQEPFLNAAGTGLFSADPRKLFVIIQEIEARHGRDRSCERHWGERTLDIDILLFGDLVMPAGDLIIPHPRLAERAFALRPLLDLFPEAAEPGTGRKYRKILAELDDQKIERIT